MLRTEVPLDAVQARRVFQVAGRNFRRERRTEPTDAKERRTDQVTVEHDRRCLQFGDE